MGFKATFKRFFDLEDELSDLYDDDTPQSEVPQPGEANESTSVKQFRSRITDSNKVLSIPSVQEQSVYENKIKWVHPTQYEDVLQITDYLQEHHIVVFTTKGLPIHDATRMIDFLSGAIHMTNGSIRKIRSLTFICAIEWLDLTDEFLQSVERRFPDF